MFRKLVYGVVIIAAWIAYWTFCYLVMYRQDLLR